MYEKMKMLHEFGNYGVRGEVFSGRCERLKSRHSGNKHSCEKLGAYKLKREIVLSPVI